MQFVLIPHPNSIVHSKLKKRPLPKGRFLFLSLACNFFQLKHKSIIMKIALASDHAGFQLKENLKSYLQSKGHAVTDFGCDSEERVDYPDFAQKAARAVAEGKAERGVLVCGSGIGICMAANKIKGIRAAVLRIEDDAKLSREHNDANVACLGGRLTKPKEAQQFLDIFLDTPFEGGRHVARIEKMSKI